MNRPEAVQPESVSELALQEPEGFPAALLLQPPGARQEYFEQHCLIEHPRLLEALQMTIQNLCPPGEGARARRSGNMVLVIGPSRVGKTTFIRLLQEQLLQQATAQMRCDASFIPFASITAAGSESGRFDWPTYYKSVLRSLQDPFVDGKVVRLPTRELRGAMEAALIHRRPLAVIVDEAHHLAKAASGRRLQDQLDHLKYFENATGVSHVLVGTYEMRPFRYVNAQLACRSLDVHFPRYNATKEEDCQMFRSVLWALQRQLPVEKEPHLDECWKFLYARSIGCIGLVKLHLNRALNLALAEQAQTITERHLHQTALSEKRVELALRNAIESEAELAETAGADERLLTLLGLKPSQTSRQSTREGDNAAQPVHRARKRPGTRAEGRDATGPKDEAEEQTRR